MLPAELESFSFIVRTFIGPPDSPGEESFDVVVCSPQWLAARCREVGLYDARTIWWLMLSSSMSAGLRLRKRYQDWDRGP